VWCQVRKHCQSDPLSNQSALRFQGQRGTGRTRPSHKK